MFAEPFKLKYNPNDKGEGQRLSHSLNTMHYHRIGETMQANSNYKLSSLLIMPMLPEKDLSGFRAVSSAFQVETEDISIGVKELFGDQGGLLTVSQRIGAKDVNRLLFGERQDYTLLLEDHKDETLEIGDLVVYGFRTGVAFACLVLTYPKMEMLGEICHPGYAKGWCHFHWQDGGEEVLLEQIIEDRLESLGLHSFYGKDSFFLEAFVYNCATVPERFKTLEEIRQITFNMHMMASLEDPVTDLSEEDVAYVYAVKDETLGSYRWGGCVSSQTISYATADVEMDHDAEMKAQIRAGLPVVVLALYEKYTCLLFGRQLLSGTKKKSAHIRDLKRRMLEFKAYGTVTPATLSRWYNIRMIYANLLRFFGVEEAIHEIGDKLEILADAQKEIDDARSNALMTGITIFGIVSILDSLLSIYEVIVNGTTGEWMVLRSSAAALILVFLGLILLIRKLK